MPATINHVHLMGICGTGMAALAGMLQQQGFRITGSDANVYPPMSDFLAQRRIKVLAGYAPENLTPRPDLVIVGNVIRATNPEARALAQARIPYLSMPQALSHFFLQHKKPLVVTGTHGKTTTSSLLASVLHRCGADPGLMIGGIVEEFGGNFRLGAGDYFVVEGDEYDTAFFNKVSKFLHYRPFGAICTSIEFDHADIFDDLDAIESAFAAFVRLLPPEGILVACGDDPLVARVAHKAECPVITYGQSTACQWQLKQMEPQGLQTRFTVTGPRQFERQFTIPLPGRHNCLNGLAVIALLHHYGLDTTAIGHGLATFQGVRRRQQVRGIAGGITVIDDFAHHPTAVRETINGLRGAWPKARLIIVFEPRTNSSRRAVFQDQYATAFGGADLVLVREHLPLDTVPAELQFSSRQLSKDLRTQGLTAHYFPDTTAILEFLKTEARPGDVIAVLSNGGFDNIHDRLLGQFKDLA